VLVLIGLLLRKRLPLLTLLIPGGLAAIFFGFMFGSIFSREDIIPALWLHPLHEPITVLAAALGMGILFLFFGMAIDLLQAVWRGRLMHWLLAHSGITVAYAALLLTYWMPSAIWGLPLGIAMTVLGARDAEGNWTPMALAGAVGELVEALMRLLVSSVSFSRVGAFALAHAGLSTAIVGIADAVGGAGMLVIMLLGNALIIGLEGLVTGIQTTRLVLFEFFTRFYKAEGREFRPLDLPKSLSHLREEKTP
jgi:V/A-type H+-transporting ATPase subunit I